MQVMVRLSQDLARVTGRARFAVTLDDPATVADLFDALRVQYPALAAQLPAAIPIITGQHTGNDTPLAAGQEVSLLTPISGGGIGHPEL